MGELDEYYEDFYGYGSRALIVTGKSSAKNGALGDVLRILKKLEIDCIVYNNVTQNPPIESVSECATIGLDFKADFIIAIGGGSAIDVAKAASVLITCENPNDTTILFCDGLDEFIPVIAVPTTAGTGSESTGSAILTSHEQKTKVSIKRRVYCKKAFINVNYTIGLPDEVTLSTAIDVLSHYIDGYMSTNANLETDALAENGFREFSKLLQNIAKRDFDLNFRKKIMMMSNCAGHVISVTRTTLPHILGYPLTYQKRVLHGFSCGLLTYKFLEFHKDTKKKTRLLDLCGFTENGDFGLFMKSVCPNPNCTEVDIQRYTDTVWADRSRLHTHPFDVEREDILNIYRESLLI